VIPKRRRPDRNEGVVADIVEARAGVDRLGGSDGFANEEGGFGFGRHFRDERDVGAFAYLLVDELEKPEAGVEGAAELVVAAVVKRREELLEDPHRRPGEVDAVVAGGRGAVGGPPEIRREIVDVVRRERFGVDRQETEPIGEPERGGRRRDDALSEPRVPPPVFGVPDLHRPEPPWASWANIRPPWSLIRSVSRLISAIRSGSSKPVIPGTARPSLPRIGVAPCMIRPTPAAAQGSSSSSSRSTGSRRRRVRAKERGRGGSGAGGYRSRPVFRA